MKTVTFYGSSDDLIEVEGVPGADEFYANSNGHVEGVFVVGGKIQVLAMYAYNGCWCFAICQVEEEIPLPDWPIRFSQADNGYSVYLEIDVPDDAAFVVRRDNRDA